MTSLPEESTDSSPVDGTVPQPMDVDEPTVSSREDAIHSSQPSHDAEHAADMSTTEEHPQDKAAMNADEEAVDHQEMEHDQAHQGVQEYAPGYDQQYNEQGRHDEQAAYDQEYAQGQGQEYAQDQQYAHAEGQEYAQGAQQEFAEGQEYAQRQEGEYAQGNEHKYGQDYERGQGKEYAEGRGEGAENAQGYEQAGHYDESAPAQEEWQHDASGEHAQGDASKESRDESHSLRPHPHAHEAEPVRRLSFQHHAETNSNPPEERPSIKRSASSEAIPALGRRPSTSRGRVEKSEKESSQEPAPATNASKASRPKREPTKKVPKVPKVYPPRKPRVRSVAAEAATLTLRTDSALSTLASAAVAIKNHQGDLSTLSVPPLSPSVHDAQQASSSSPVREPVSSPKPSSEQGADDASASSATASRPVKSNILQDSAGYRCELCPGERFGRVHDLKRHQISKHNEMTWPCDFCHRPFVRRDALLRHYSVKANRRDGVHPTADDMNRLQEAKARAKLVS
jgi:hypothetical protein